MFDHHYQETEHILVTHLILKTFLILASKIQAHTIELAISEMEEWKENHVITYRSEVKTKINTSA